MWQVERPSARVFGTSAKTGLARVPVRITDLLTKVDDRHVVSSPRERFDTPVFPPLLPSWSFEAETYYYFLFVLQFFISDQCSCYGFFFFAMMPPRVNLTA